jgi:hypothetical protein
MNVLFISKAFRRVPLKIHKNSLQSIIELDSLELDSLELDSSELGSDFVPNFVPAHIEKALRRDRMFSFKKNSEDQHPKIKIGTKNGTPCF